MHNFGHKFDVHAFWMELNIIRDLILSKKVKVWKVYSKIIKRVDYNLFTWSTQRRNELIDL